LLLVFNKPSQLALTILIGEHENGQPVDFAHHIFISG